MSCPNFNYKVALTFHLHKIYTVTSMHVSCPHFKTLSRGYFKIETGNFSVRYITIPNLSCHVRLLSFGPVVCNLKFTCGNNNKGSGEKLRRAARSQISFLKFLQRNLLIRSPREWQVKIYRVT